MESLDDVSNTITNVNNCNNNVNNTNNKFDIVFIGGGPATLSFFSYLIKVNFLDSLLKSDILIIEKSNCFGSGCLGKYGINSNTSAEGFVRLICKGSQEESGNDAKHTLSPNKLKVKKIDGVGKGASPTNNNNNIFESENMKYKKSYFNKKLIPIFSDLFNSLPCQMLLSLGSRPGPLTLIGNFLDCVGNSISDYILKKFNKRILMLNSEVLSISSDNKNNLKKANDYNYELQVKQNSSNSTVIIKSKVLILGSGARQKFDLIAKKEILSHIPHNMFYHSDFILQEKGYVQLINNLKEKSASPNKKIIIIGGSHSGFSCAWLLLNGPADYSNSKIRNDAYKTKLNPQCLKCKNANCCLGSTDIKKWNVVNNPGIINDYEINILYRDHIKVYYHTEQEALNDGYSVFDTKRSVNKNGNVYPFIGIRGDAKELYRKSVKGTEKRVKLIKINSIGEQKALLQNCAAVIWAGGYTTERIKMMDKVTNRDIELCEDENFQYEVDKELHLISKKESNNSIQNLFGIGQGYSTHSVEVLINGKNARADSVNLYNTFIAKKLIKSIQTVYTFKEKDRDRDRESEREKVKSQNRDRERNRDKSKENNNNFTEKKLNNNFNTEKEGVTNSNTNSNTINKLYSKKELAMDKRNISINNFTNKITNNQNNQIDNKTNPNTLQQGLLISSENIMKSSKGLEATAKSTLKRINTGFKITNESIQSPLRNTLNRKKSVNSIMKSTLKETSSSPNSKENLNNNYYNITKSVELYNPNKRYELISQTFIDRDKTLQLGIKSPLVKSTDSSIYSSLPHKLSDSTKNLNSNPVTLIRTRNIPSNNRIEIKDKKPAKIFYLPSTIIATQINNNKDCLRRKEDFDIYIPHPSTLNLNPNPNHSSKFINGEKTLTDKTRLMVSNKLSPYHMASKSPNKDKGTIAAIITGSKYNQNEKYNANKFLIYDATYNNHNFRRASPTSKDGAVGEQQFNIHSLINERKVV